MDIRATQTPSVLYTLASNNFFAESINFFLRDSSVTSIVSNKGPFSFGSPQPARKSTIKLVVRKSGAASWTGDTLTIQYLSNINGNLTPVTGPTLTFTNNNSSISGDDIGVSGMNPSQVAAQINTAINGHATYGSVITSTVNDSVITLQQDTAGLEGNFCRIGGTVVDNIFIQSDSRVFRGGRGNFDIYKMRFNVQNRGLIMYDNKSSFGPPVDNTNPSLDRHAVGNNACWDFDFDPYVPPFQKRENNSYVEFTFVPTKQIHTLDEVFSGLTSSYSDNTVSNRNKSRKGFSTNKKFRMTLSSSLNLFSSVEEPILEQNIDGNVERARDPSANETRKRWLIQPKWETPILNFANQSASYNVAGTITKLEPNEKLWEIDLSQPGQFLYGAASGSIPISRGMWHQYGYQAAGNTGLYGFFSSVPGYKDLTSVVGFPETEDKIKFGVPPRDGERKISEAVVAIPYIIESDEIHFFDLDPVKIQRAVSNIPGAASPLDPTIVHQIQMMKKYIFPPRFDFIKFPERKPVAMYVFEFEHSLSRRDVTDIWQNLMPSIGISGQADREDEHSGKIEPTSVTVGHVLASDGEAINPLGDDYKEKTRWLVFKVKKKANRNYFTKIKDSAFQQVGKGSFNPYRQGRIENFIGSSIEQIEESNKYSFNWPYDYFSLVELVKIKAEVELE